MNPDSRLNRACKTLRNPTEDRAAWDSRTPSDDRVRRCGAPSSTEQRSLRGDRTVRGPSAARGRRADEPLRHGKRSVAEACARSRGQALWSLGAARGGARPREHTQAVVSRRRSPLRSAAEWAGREPTSSRPTAWCRAALEPRRSARTPPGRRPSQPPSSRLNRTGSCPPARLRTARPAGSRGGRSAGRGESAPSGMRSVQTCDTVAALQGAFPIYSRLSARHPKRVKLKPKR